MIDPVAHRSDPLATAQLRIKKLETYVQKVKAMREAQKRYFKERSQEALVEAKQLEKEVDAAG